MPWDTSNRRAELPPDWPTLREAVKARAQGRCEVTMRDGSRCRDRGTDCHHLGDKHDHRPQNLQWICAWHHKRITAQQAAAARTPVTTARPKPRHPGLR